MLFIAFGRLLLVDPGPVDVGLMVFPDGVVIVDRFAPVVRTNRFTKFSIVH